MKKLSNEELIKLAKKDKNAKNYFFERNRNFCYYVAHKYNNSGFEFDDLVQMAYIGMVNAFNTFDSDMDYKFATYAYRCMANEILINIRSSKRQIDAISLEDKVKISNSEDVEIMDFVKSDSNFEEDFINNEHISFLLSKLYDTVKKTDYKIFYCYYIKNYRQVDISIKTGMAQPSVSRSIRRTAKVLKKLNEKYS